jgi:acetylornithine/LysW-gamma-L-lysine aminotransferase
LYGERGLRILSGRGVRLRDDSGREYLDFLAGHGAALFGHGHPNLAEALRKAASEPWTVGAGLTPEVRERAAERLGALLAPGARVLLVNSGTEALEAALKLALLLRPGRRRILALRRGFHGRTLGALSLTFNPRFREPWRDRLIPAEHLPPEAIPGALDGDVAAVFLEPLQGEGGVHPLPEGLGTEISRACRASGTLLVADEVQCGFGRCGETLYSRRVGLEPDLVCLAKGLAGGLPAGALLWREGLGEFPPGTHGSTYGGNPLVCTLILAALDLIEAPGFLEKIQRGGDRFRSLLEGIGFPIRQVRGAGCLVGVEIDRKVGPAIRDLQTRGLLALGAGPTTIRFLPPVVSTEADYGEAAEILASTLREAERHG